MIVLKPQNYATNQQPSGAPVQVANNWTSAVNNDLPVSQIKQPLPIVIDQVTNVSRQPAPRLSISEPSPLGAAGHPLPGSHRRHGQRSGDPSILPLPPPPASASSSAASLLRAAGQPRPGLRASTDHSRGRINSTAVGNLTPASSLPESLPGRPPSTAGQPLDRSTTPTRQTPYTTDGEIDWTKTTYNPYRTIDSMPIDLTVYNGWETPTNLATATPKRRKPPMTIPFQSRQRGDYALWTGRAGPTREQLFNNLWVKEWQTPSSAYPKAPTTPLIGQMFPYQLQHTLGYISYGYYGNASAANANGTP